MAIFTNASNGNGKSKWTREQDALLIAMSNEGKGRQDIAKAVKHPENSITYRVGFIKKAEAALAEKLAESGEEVETVDQVLDTIKY